MEKEKSKVLIKFLLIFRQSGDVLFFLYARRLRGYTATVLNTISHMKVLEMYHLEIIVERVCKYVKQKFG